MAIEDWLISVMMMMMMMRMMIVMVMVRRTRRQPLFIDPRRGDFNDPSRQTDRQTLIHSIA